MRYLTLFLRKKILINPHEKLYDIGTYIFLYIGFVLACFILELVLSIAIGWLLNGSAVININNTNDLLLILLSFSLPSTLCFSVIPIILFIVFMKWSINTTIVGNLTSTISGGEKHKTAIIRDLIKGSDVILFDEPTASLDKVSIQQFFNILNILKENHIIILITHNLEYSEIADKVIFLNPRKGGNEVI